MADGRAVANRASSAPNVRTAGRGAATGTGTGLVGTAGMLAISRFKFAREDAAAAGLGAEAGAGAAGLGAAGAGLGAAGAGVGAAGAGVGAADAEVLFPILLLMKKIPPPF